MCLENFIQNFKKILYKNFKKPLIIWAKVSHNRSQKLIWCYQNLRFNLKSNLSYIVLFKASSIIMLHVFISFIYKNVLRMLKALNNASTINKLITSTTRASYTNYSDVISFLSCKVISFSVELGLYYIYCDTKNFSERIVVSTSVIN